MALPNIHELNLMNDMLLLNTISLLLSQYNKTDGLVNTKFTAWIVNQYII